MFHVTVQVAQASLVLVIKANSTQSACGKAMSALKHFGLSDMLDYSIGSIVRVKG